MSTVPFSADRQEIWHRGERALQEQAGVADRMEQVGQRNVRPLMPDQHRTFFAQLPFIVVGSVDGHGDPWATLIAGRPGFVASPSATSLEIGLHPDPSDPASAGMGEGDVIGLLGIELHTRRRNRANGVIGRTTSTSLLVDVGQSFGNCPQYIRLRDIACLVVSEEPTARDVEESTSLDAASRGAIAAADTFFVASSMEGAGRRQVDVSHRGGKAGFVRVDEDGTLTIPDFTGNLFFMTLGNILLSGKAGLVFPDFATGDLLQMTGDAEVVTEAPEIAAFDGAERLWTFRPRHVVRRRGVLPLRWSPRKDGSSPNSLQTGDWDTVADRVRMAELAGLWRPFKVIEVVEESRSIRSFRLRPDDGSRLVPAQAGQHLPIRIRIPGAGDPIVRTYTLSDMSETAYRISVKRDGLVSRHLHDHVREGDVIEVHGPAGAFTIDAHADRPVVLLAGGIGITPLLAMLRHIVDEGALSGGIRPTTLFYAVHSLADRAFDRELARLVEAAKGAVRVVRVLGDARGAREGYDFDIAGRLDMSLLAQFLPFGDYDFFLCGPSRFTQALYDGLRSLNVADDRLHAESFGPSSLVRSANTGAVETSCVPVSTRPVRVAFARSGKAALWALDSGSLLELAEGQGLSPPYGCRSGNCGTCKTKLLGGTVAYRQKPTATTSEDEVLICCVVPGEGAGDVELAI